MKKSTNNASAMDCCNNTAAKSNVMDYSNNVSSNATPMGYSNDVSDELTDCDGCCCGGKDKGKKK